MPGASGFQDAPRRIQNVDPPEASVPHTVGASESRTEGSAFGILQGYTWINEARKGLNSYQYYGPVFLTRL